MSSKDQGTSHPVVPQVPAEADDHHREIWSDAFQTSRSVRPPVYYIENHNGQVGYAEAAFDYRIAVEELLPRLNPMETGNWVAPVLNLARLGLELQLKALLEVITARDATVDAKLLRRHDLAALWSASTTWLVAHGYGISRDARLGATAEVIAAFHAVDPDGDLFRFAQSWRTRFGKRKSYDRAGVNYDTFGLKLLDSYGLLNHWEAVVFRERLCKEMDWDTDPFFNADDFPKTQEGAAHVPPN